MKSIYIMAAMAVMACGVHAQDINREITVDRELLPVEKDARRLPLMPHVTLPDVEAVKLSTTQRAVTTDVPATVRRLDPAGWTDPDALAGSRGYLMAALGAPAFDGMLSAGYRLVDNKTTDLGAWLQWDSNVYSRKGEWYRTHAGALGIDVAHSFGGKSMIEGSFSWTIDRHNMPRIGQHGYWLTSNRADVDAAWHSASGSLKYNIDARYGWFGYSSAGVDAPAGLSKGVSQHNFAVGADAWLPTSDHAQVGLMVDLDLLGSSAHAFALPSAGYAINDGGTTGVLTLTPMWRLHTGVWTLALGPRIDITFNGDKAFHIAPDVEVGWTPSSFFAMTVRAAGGEHLNPISSLSQFALRQVPYAAPGMSHLPVTLDADVTVGPWRGMWLRLYGGWAKANSWAMPVEAGNLAGGGMLWENTDIAGGHVGAEVGAKVRSWLEVEACYTAATSGYDKAYYAYRYRARHVVDASISVRPVKPLNIKIAYQLRAGRAVYRSYAGNGVLNHVPVAHERVGLRNVSSLGVNVSYAVNSRLTVFARGENLLGRDAEMLDLSPEQGVHGMVGASLRF